MKTTIILTVALMLLIPMQMRSSDYFDTNIEVNGVKHKLLICSPANYNPANEYPLVIGLHYCGSNASAYRDALRKMADSLNLIIACPDNSSSEIPDKDINMLQITIDSVAAKYNIDQSQMYLNGMSCNGKVTLKHGLDKTINFKGIFPWEPWITMADLKLFDLHTNLPVTIAVGTADPNYLTILNLYDSLKNNGANVNLVLVKGIDHTLGFATFADEMIRSLNYVNDTNAIEMSKVSDFDMLDTEEKDIEITVKHKANKDVTIRLQVSNITLMGEPAITTTTEDGVIKVHFKVSPVDTKKGKAVFVLEAVEKGGLAIEQSTFKVNVSIGLQSNIKALNSIDAIFPNPATDFVKIKSTSKSIDYCMYDASGHLVLQESNFETSGAIDIKSLSSGMYLLSLQNSGKPETYKLFVK